MKRRPISRNRKSAISPASRARCLKPAPHGPRWTDLSGSLAFGSEAYPPLWGPRQHAGDGQSPSGTPPRAPSDARLARRDRAASAVATRVCVLHPFATTAPDPHSKTPLEAPLVDRGARIIREVFRAGITYFREVIPAHFYCAGTVILLRYIITYLFLRPAMKFPEEQESSRPQDGSSPSLAMRARKPFFRKFA